MILLWVSTALAGPAPLTLSAGGWSATFYGFIEADHIYDSTQSFNDIAGNGLVAKPGTYAGQHGRLMFGVRNSRFGLRLGAPEWHRMKASGTLEMDFMGNQPSDVSEAGFWQSPGFRIRHAFLKLETPFVDVLIGQTWHLFGWQGAYQPNTVEIQGVPGEVYGRTPQIRLSKGVAAGPVRLDFALAVTRPPQRDSAVPEGVAGIRLSSDKWTGMQTVGSTGSLIAPISVGVSAAVRQFRLPEFSANSTRDVHVMGWGVNAGAFLPIVPATAEHKGNSLSILGEYAYTVGMPDLYSGLTGGVAFPALPNPDGADPAPVYTPRVNNGFVGVAPDGSFQAVRWQSFLVGAQYYFPRLDGRLWVSANYSHIGSGNAKLFGAATRQSEDFVDGNLFGDVTPAVRLGLEYAWFHDRYGDGAIAVNHRVQFSAFYLF